MYLTQIKKIIALLIVVVFVFSIIPQKYIHDVVAHHVDQKQCLVHKQVPIEQVEKASIHCNYDVIVSTVPFLLFDFSIKVPSFEYNLVKNKYVVIYYLNKNILSKDLRGPPQDLAV